MFKTIPKFCSVGILALLVTTVLAACSPPNAVPHTSATPFPSVTPQASATPFPSVTPQASAISSSGATPQTSSIAPSTTEMGVTIAWANVRTDTSSSAPIDHVDPPNTAVTIYATVSGQIISGGSSTWYRISSFNTSPLYIYGDLVAVSSENTNDGTSSAPSGQGKIIVISISQQELDAYDNGTLFVSTPVATGRPQLPTPTGTYHFFAKYSPYTFVSPWPVGSPYYYPTSTANYAMEWRQGGYFLHNAPWRGYFGRGANYWHWDPKMGEDPGTHGCIDVPTAPMSQIYRWADSGTTIQINS